MPIPILDSLDLNKLQILNAADHVLAGAPVAPAVGQHYFNSTVGRWFIWDGAAWGNKATDSDLLEGQNSAYHRARANHTGTQLAATVSDFDAQVRTSRLDQMAAPTADVSLNTRKVTNLAAPTGANDAARLVDVQNAAAGLAPKDSVRVATTAAVTLATGFENGDVIDGVTLVTGDRVLAKNQAAAAENGIYTVNASGAPTRATDFDAEAEIRGALIPVEEGTTNGNTLWMVTTDAPIVVGTTSLAFSQIGAFTVVGGAGLTLTGTTLDVGAGLGITVAADTVAVDTAVVVRKYAVTIGDNSATSFVVNHALGTEDVTVEVYETGGSKRKAMIPVEHTDANNVTVKFAVAPAVNSYRVVVHG